MWEDSPCTHAGSGPRSTPNKTHRFKNGSLLVSLGGPGFILSVNTCTNYAELCRQSIQYIHVHLIILYNASMSIKMKATPKYSVSTKYKLCIIFQYVLILQSDARTGVWYQAITYSQFLYCTLRIESVNVSRSAYGQCKNYIVNFARECRLSWNIALKI